MIVRFVYNRTFQDINEYEDGTSDDVIEEHFQAWLYDACLSLGVFDTEGMTDEEIDNTLFEYGHWHVEDK